MKKLLFLTSLFPVLSFGQVSLATMGTAYTENFNSLPNATDGAALATWTNNSTLAGWYVAEQDATADDLPRIEASCGPLGSNVDNSGSVYIIASGSDRNIGSRSSGGTDDCYYGVRLVNNTGSTITSIYVAFYAEQWSIAENTNSGTSGCPAGSYCNNTEYFEYQVGATSITAGTWTNVASLAFSQLHNCTLATCTGSSAQRVALDGNLSTNRSRLADCITVTVNNGQEIWLRWRGPDDGANDHHMQVDDLEVWPFDIACATILPVELLSFRGDAGKKDIALSWTTASEINNDYFTIERSVDGTHFETIGTVEGAGNSSQALAYHFTDGKPHDGINYYRLKQTDFNGEFSYSGIAPVEFNNTGGSISIGTGDNGQTIITASGLKAGNMLLSFYDAAGRLVLCENIESEGFFRKEISTELHTGLYFVSVTDGVRQLSAKFIR
ncbi:MAG: putative extracellular nuclease [Bacteroidetes bacterium]|nr:MAG: putative extracellular nuclease [Bacteroidota bacterium]